MTPADRTNVGSDFLQLNPGQAPHRGRTDWLVGQLRDALAQGRLTLGSTLPPIRVLAAELGVSRGTVSEAYRQLCEDGYLAGRRPLVRARCRNCSHCRSVRS